MGRVKQTRPLKTFPSRPETAQRAFSIVNLSNDGLLGRSLQHGLFWPPLHQSLWELHLSRHGAQGDAPLNRPSLVPVPSHESPLVQSGWSLDVCYGNFVCLWQLCCNLGVHEYQVSQKSC